MDEGLSLTQRAWRGNCGLAKTFWRVGVLTGSALILFFVVAVQLTDSILIGFAGFLAVWAWQAFAGVAIWRAAARHDGSALWATLARGSILVSTLCLGYGTGLLVGIF